MIPYKDENPTHHLPVVTYTVLGLNILAWVLIQGLGSEPQLSDSICRYGLIPGALLTGAGSAPVSGYCGVLSQDWSVVVTSMFMHAGWWHLVGNMWFLWLFADNIEDVLRPAKFIVFYLVGGVVAVIAQIVSEPSSAVPMVGASGAIGGIMGAYAWLYPTVRVRLAVVLGLFVFRRTIPAWVLLTIWFSLQLISVAMSLLSESESGIAFWAHIGGFLAGFFLIQLITRKPPSPWELP